jgi:hypothetical protein
MKTFAKILSLLILVYVILGAMSCTSRSRKYSEAREATTPTTQEVVKLIQAPIKLESGGTIEVVEIAGMVVAIYDNGQFGNSMVVVKNNILKLGNKRYETK